MSVDPETSAFIRARLEEEQEHAEDRAHLERLRRDVNAADLLRELRESQGRTLHEVSEADMPRVPEDAEALAELRQKLYGQPAPDDGVLWEDEGMIHRAALTSHGNYGDAVLWVAQIKNMDGQTVYLTEGKRIELAEALLRGLPAIGARKAWRMLQTHYRLPRPKAGN